MRTDHLFLTRISELRRLIIKERIKRTVATTLLLSLLLSAVAVGFQRIGWFPLEGYSIHPLLVLASLVFSVLYTFRTKKSFLDELTEIDIRLGLKERLSTAYECHRLGRESLFLDLLIEDAGNRLGLIKANQIFPRKISTVHLLIPLFAAVIIILASIEFPPVAPLKNRTHGEGLKQVGAKMEKYAKQGLRDIKGTEKESRKNLFQQMERIAEELKSQSMTERKLLKSLGDLMKEAEAERTRVARQLEAQLSLGDVSHTPMLRPLRKEEVAPNELKELTEQLRELFEGEVPTSLLRDISDLDQTRRLELFLDERIHEVRSALADDGGSHLLEEEKGVLLGKVSEKTDKPDNNETSSGHALEALQFWEANFKRQTSLAPGRTKDGAKKSEKSRPTPDEDLPFAAGREKGEGKKKPPYELQTPNGPAIKDEGVSGQEDRYNVYVRSLPTIGKAKVKEEDVIRSYRQELESALQKEDIPVRYREYIKGYFLSIGLGEEEHRNDHTN